VLGHTEEADDRRLSRSGTARRKIQLYNLSIMLNYRALSTLGQTSTRNALINFLKKYRKLALLLCLTTRAIKLNNYKNFIESESHKFLLFD